MALCSPAAVKVPPSTSSSAAFWFIGDFCSSGRPVSPVPGHGSWCRREERGRQRHSSAGGPGMATAGMLRAGKATGGDARRAWQEALRLLESTRGTFVCTQRGQGAKNTAPAREQKPSRAAACLFAPGLRAHGEPPAAPALAPGESPPAKSIQLRHAGLCVFCFFLFFSSLLSLYDCCVRSEDKSFFFFIFPERGDLAPRAVPAPRMLAGDLVPTLTPTGDVPPREKQPQNYQGGSLTPL